MDAFQGHSDTPLWRAEMALPQVPASTVEPREDVLVVGSSSTHKLSQAGIGFLGLLCSLANRIHAVP